MYSPLVLVGRRWDTWEYKDFPAQANSMRSKPQIEAQLELGVKYPVSCYSGDFKVHILSV